MLRYLIVLAFAQSAFSDPSLEMILNPTPEQFVSRIRSHLSEPTNTPYKQSPIQIGASFYTDINGLWPSQPEISLTNSVLKIAKKKGKYEWQWNRRTKAFLFNHDGGKSLIPLKDPIQVVKGPRGFYIIDGHHHFYAAAYAGSKTIPVEVMGDFSNLTERAFWEKMRQKKWTYEKDRTGRVVDRLPSARNIGLNENRYLAALLRLEVKTSGNTFTIEDRSAQSIWAKVNGGVPFVEFYIAEILYKDGIEYKTEWGTEVPPHIVNKARSSLERAKASGEWSIFSQAPLVSKALAEGSEEALQEYFKTKLWPAKNCNSLEVTLP